MAEEMRRSWSCRLIERVRAARPDWDRDVGSGGPNLWRRWTQRHEERCPHCRAERERWDRALTMLRPPSLVSAPPHILDKVMARIAPERSDRALQQERAAYSFKPERKASRAPRSSGWDLLEQALFWAVWAVALGWAASVRVPGWIAWWSARWQAWFVLVEGWAGAMQSGWNALASAVGALPSGIQPYFVAGLWCLVGFSAATASAALAGKLLER